MAVSVVSPTTHTVPDGAGGSCEARELNRYRQLRSPRRNLNKDRSHSTAGGGGAHHFAAEIALFCEGGRGVLRLPAHLAPVAAGHPTAATGGARRDGRHDSCANESRGHQWRGTSGWETRSEHVRMTSKQGRAVSRVKHRCRALRRSRAHQPPGQCTSRRWNAPGREDRDASHGCAPRVVLVDVLRAVRGCVAVVRPEIRVERGLLAAVAAVLCVRVCARAVPAVAGRAPD